MPIQRMSVGLAVVCLAAACAAPSVQHTAQSVDHSAQATGHGVSAVASGVATVSAVPVMAAGSVLTVSGAAIEEVGTASVIAGSAVLQAEVGGSCMTTPSKTPQCVAPDGPPQLN